MATDERQPLLSGSSPQERAASASPQTNPPISATPLNLSDLPQIDPNDTSPSIPCQVCKATIQLEGKLHQHVVKCTSCNEAMPIKPPPPGKIYVRCPCNCLLICRSGSLRIACPRKNCSRVMNVAYQNGQFGGNLPNVGFTGANRAGGDNTDAPVQHRVQCGHCNESFTTSAIRYEDTVFVRCSLCNKTSFTSAFYRFKRLVFAALVALLLVIAAVIVAVTTMSAGATPLMGIWIGLVAVAVIALAVFSYYLCQPISHPLAP
jgi:phosphatidylinositol-4,5-bisphosphate 4-phosphatase